MFGIAIAFLLLGIILTEKQGIFNPPFNLLDKVVASLYVLFVVLQYRLGGGILAFGALITAWYVSVIMIRRSIRSWKGYRAMKVAFKETEDNSTEFLRRSVDGNDDDILHQMYLNNSPEAQASTKKLYDRLCAKPVQSEEEIEIPIDESDFLSEEKKDEHPS